MKIAVIASGKGEKARHVHEFFKEGDRVEIAYLLTDSGTSEIAEYFRDEGVEIIELLPETIEESADMATLLRDNNIELVMVDSFNAAVPPPIQLEYGEAMLYPSGINEAPVEIIQKVNKIRQERDARLKNAAPPSISMEGEKPAEQTVADEWKKVLGTEEELPSLQPISQPKYSNDSAETSDGTTESMEQQPTNTSMHQAQVVNNMPQQPLSPPNNHQEPMPNTYLVWAVIATVLCCLIPGIVAIVYSSSVSSRYFAGDIEGAKRASRNAQIWIIISVVCGIIWATLYLPMILITG